MASSQAREVTESVRFRRTASSRSCAGFRNVDTLPMHTGEVSRTLGQCAGVLLFVASLSLTGGCDTNPGNSSASKVKNCGTVTMYQPPRSYDAGLKRANQCMRAAWRAHRSAILVLPGTDVEGNDATAIFRVGSNRTVTYSSAGGRQIACSTKTWLRTGSCKVDQFQKPPKMTPDPCRWSTAATCTRRQK